MFMPLMLVESAKNPFDDPSYLFEIKFNGIRGELIKDIKGNVTLFTRHRTPITQKFPEFNDIQLPTNCILDGEIIVFNQNTEKDDFELVMQRFRANKKEKIRSLIDEIPAVYIVFDILFYKGKDITDLTLIERKRILEETLVDSIHANKIKYVNEKGIELFEAVQQRGLEGIVAKNLYSKYFCGHRPKHAWYKVINWTYVDAYITGYRKNQFGLLCAIKENGRFKNVGIVELGMTPVQRQAFYGVVKDLIIDEDKMFYYIDPVLRCKIKGRGRTNKGYLFTPVFCDFILE
jgi:DNA ligase 1